MRENLNSWLSIILKLLAIVALVGGVLYLSISIYANLSLNKTAAAPSITKAQYSLVIQTTGDMLLTPKYDVAKSPNNPLLNIYTLHGFYRKQSDTWVWDKKDMPLDEYYFGKITVKKREVTK